MRLSRSKTLIALVAPVALPMVSLAAFGQTLTTRMEPTKKIIVLGEPVWVDVSVTNRSQQSFFVDFGPPCLNLKPLKIQIPGADPDGRDRARCGWGTGGDCAYSMPPKIAPGETLSHRYLLDGDFQITHPGSYLVRLEKVIQYAAAPENGASSPPLPLEKKVTGYMTYTMQVEAADPDKLLAMEQAFAQTVTERTPNPPPPGLDRPVDMAAVQKQSELRYGTAEGLSRYPAAGMEPIFRAWLDGGEFETYAVLGLKRLNTSAAREALANFAESKTMQRDPRYQSMRFQAVDALADLGDRSYLPVLERLTRDSDRSVRNNAVQGLGRLGGEQELGLLTELAHKGGTAADWENIIWALGDSASLKAVPLLIEFATLPNPAQLDFTYRALRMLTHLEFPSPGQRPVPEVQGDWREFWKAHQQDARAYGPYECSDTVAIPVRQSPQDAVALIQGFTASRDAADLRKALDAVKQITEGYTGELKPDPQIVTLWVKLYSAIDSVEASIAPTLKMAVTQVTLPDLDGKPWPYPGSISPSEIKDPAERKRYEDAVAENKRRVQVSNNFGQIERVKQDVHSNFWGWAEGLYHGNADALAAIVRQARALGCSDVRAEWIRAVMEGPRGTFAPNEPPVPRPVNAGR